jgi:hypothetical protein
LFFPFAAESKRQSSHSPIHCNENENKKCELASLPFRPFLPKEKGNPFLSLPLFPGRSASGIQLLIDLKNRGKFKKKFALESARLFVSTPSNPIHYFLIHSYIIFLLYYCLHYFSYPIIYSYMKYLVWGKIKMWMQSILIIQSHFPNFTLLINSPNQNEIVGRFPVRVHSLVVRLFPVWTPSQTHTTVIVIDLCGVNGLVAVH